MRHQSQRTTRTFSSVLKAVITATSTALLAIVIPGNLVLANNSQTFTDYAKVIHVEPSFRYVTVQVPQRICTPRYNNHTDYHHNNRPNHHNREHHFRGAGNHRRDASGAAFIGGIIGGVIGHEVTKNVSGRNKVAGTITGAVIGSTLAGAATRSGNRHGQHYAHNGANRHHRPHSKPHKRHHQHHNQQRCTTTTQSRQERRPNGYNVTYVYHGRTFHTRTQHHPGQRIAVRIALSTH